MKKIRESIKNNSWDSFKKEMRKVFASKNDVAGNQACTLK
jgi:hypothetical protein